MTLMGVGLVGWAVCGWLAYGVTLGHFMRAYPISHRHAALRTRTKSVAWAMAAGGPLGLLVAVVMSNWVQFGLMWRTRCDD